MTSIEIVPSVDKRGNKRFVRKVACFIATDKRGNQFRIPIKVRTNKKIGDEQNKYGEWQKKRPFLKMDVRFAGHDEIVKIKFMPLLMDIDGKPAPPDRGTWKVEYPPHEIRERGPFKPIKRFESNLEVFESNENFAIWLATKFGEHMRDEILNHFAKAIVGKPKKGKRG